MTSDQQRDFEHQWPALAVRVNRLLKRKKLSPWLVEDLTQETGLRLIRMWPTIDQSQPLWPLTATIALNLMRDHMRKEGSHEVTSSIPDTASVENVEQRGMARLELRAVGGALSQMPDTHRRVLLAEVSNNASAPDASATRMLRMRARRKLQNLLDHASLLGIAVGDHLRRAVREAELMISKALPNHVEHISAAAISLLAAVSLGIAVVPDSPTEAGERNRAPQRSTTTSEDLRATTMDPYGSRASGRDTPRASSAQVERGKTRPAEGRRLKNPPNDPGYRGDGEDAPFPGALNYQVRLTDNTYVQGSLEVEIVGEEDAGARTESPPRGTGSINCTVSVAAVGASCMHGGDGWEDRGVRVRHRGEGQIGGQPI